MNTNRVGSVHPILPLDMRSHLRRVVDHYRQEFRQEDRAVKRVGRIIQRQGNILDDDCTAIKTLVKDRYDEARASHYDPGTPPDPLFESLLALKTYYGFDL